MSAVEENLKAAKEGISAIGELIKFAGENPNARAAANNIAEAAVTISTTLNLCLLPLAAINFGYQKARTYFHEKFADDLAAKAALIPPENIIEPKASIAGPALQGLAFAHEEVDLKNMYLTLLATAMDRRVYVTAHPAFVEVIRQITAEEAELIHSVFLYPASLPIVQIHKITEGSDGFVVVGTHVLDLRNGDDIHKLTETEGLPAMVDNWIRLGLVVVLYDRSLASEESYRWVDKRPEVTRLRSQYQSPTVTIKVQRGVMNRTAFGRQFASAVGII